MACKQYPGWEMIDCGCCDGVEWGGEHPKEYRQCRGGGVLFCHTKSGALAQYPGGPFTGRLPRKRVGNNAR